MALRPLAPRTAKLYDSVIARAFGLHFAGLPNEIPTTIAGWTEPTKALLRAAVKRRYLDAGRSEEEADEIADEVPVSWTAQRVTEVPSEEEAQRYEQVCSSLPPGRRAMALLPLAMGLRAMEAITISRRHVERAAQYGELVILRKGGKEQLLDAAHAKRLFAELLEAPAARRVSLRESPLARGRAWKVTGEILSTGNAEAAYHALHRLVRAAGAAAGIEELRPHKLRHAFATRMNRDGAPLPVIQWTLGHANIATTMRYVHPGKAEAAKFMRRF